MASSLSTTPLSTAFRAVVEANSSSFRSIAMPTVPFPSEAMAAVEAMLKEEQEKKVAVVRPSAPKTRVNFRVKSTIERVQFPTKDQGRFDETLKAARDVDDFGMPWKMPPTPVIFRVTPVSNRFCGLKLYKSAIKSQQEATERDDVASFRRDRRATRKIPRNALCSYTPVPSVLDHLVPKEQIGPHTLDPETGFTMLGNRIVNEYWCATLTQEEFEKLEEHQVPNTFPWIDAARNIDDWTDRLWQDGLPLFSPEVTDDDVLLSQVELNQVIKSSILGAPEAAELVVCKHNRFATHCARDVACRCGQCAVHCRCGKKRYDDDTDFNWLCWAKNPRSPWLWSYAWKWTQNRTPRQGLDRLPEGAKTRPTTPSLMSRRMQELNARVARAASRELRQLDAQGLFNKLKLSWDKCEAIDVKHVVELPIVGSFVKALQERNNRPSYVSVITEALFMLSHVMAGGAKFGVISVAITHFLNSSGLSAKAISTMVEWWRNRQNAQGPAEWIAGALTLICVTLVGICVVTLPKTSTIDALFNRFSRVGQMIRSSEIVAEKITPVIDHVMDFFRIHLFGYSKQDLSGWKTVEEWCNEVRALETRKLADRIATDNTLQPEVENLLEKGSKINQELDRCRVAMSSRSTVNSNMLSLHRIMNRIEKAGVGLRKSRVCPIIAHFYGDSGVGKTTALNLLNAELLYALGCRDPNDMTTKVYYRAPGQTFWDGYVRGTKIVVYDDFGTIRDSPSLPSEEALENIRAGNTAPLSLNMAGLDEKGNTMFEAPVVIWTSNRASYEFSSMTNKEALYNRITLKFRQRVKPEFAIEKPVSGRMVTSLDRTKVPRDNRLFTDFMVFDQMNPTSQEEEVLKADLSYGEMADIVRDALMKNIEFGTAYSAETVNYFQQLIANGGRRVAQAQAIPTDNQPGPSGDVRPAQAFGDAQVRRIAEDVEQEIVRMQVRAQREIEAAADGDEGVGDDEELGPAELTPDEVEELKQRVGTTIARSFTPVVHGSKWWRRIIHNATWGLTFNDEVHLDLWSTLPSIQESFHQLIPTRQNDARCLFAEYFGESCVVVKYRDIPYVTGVFTAAYEHASKSVTPLQAFSGVAMQAQGAFAKCECAGHRKNKFDMVMRTKYTQKKLAWKTVPSWISKVFEEWVGMIMSIGVLAAMFGLFEWLYNKIPNPFAKTKEAIVAEAAYSHGVRAVPNNRMEMKTSEGTTDQNAREIVDKVLSNQYLIWREASGGMWSPCGTATILTGRIAMINQHIWAAMTENFMLCNARGIQYEFQKSKCTTSGLTDEKHVSKDVILVELPVQMPVHRAILNYFMTRTDFGDHTSLPRAALVGYSVDGRQYIQYSDKVKTDDVEFQLKSALGLARVRETYRYGIETQQGDCGSVLVAFEPGKARKLCGIHVAGGEVGSPFTGTAAALHKEFLVGLLDSMELQKSHSRTDGNPIVECAPVIVLDGQGPTGVAYETELPIGLQPIGRIPSVHQPAKSKLRKSPVFGMTGESALRPAKLKPDDIHNPMQIALDKLIQQRPSINDEFLEWATQDVIQMHSRHVRSSDQRVLTFEEGIAGVEGDTCYPPINRRTSPGFGWDKKGVGKTHYLGEDEYVFDHPEVVARVSSMLQRMKEGKRSGCVWTDTLKDELRGIEKLAKGSTRMFSAGEMASTIIMRMFFDGFVAHVTRNRIYNESAIGINPEGPEWGLLRQHLQHVGRDVFAGDFKAYAESLIAQVLWKVLEVVEHHYPNATPEDKKVREMAWLDIVNSVHANGRDLYMWIQAQPSGCPFTSILNTIAHSIVVRYVYLEAASKYAPEHMNMVSYNDHVRLISYGDDDVVNVHCKVAPWFNQVTATEMYIKLGMNYTDEVKSSSAIPTRTIDEISFLKRKFRVCKRSGRVFAPLTLSTILEMPNWIKGNDVWNLTAQCLEAAAYELSHHDEVTFNSVMPLLQLASDKVREFQPVHILPYAQYHSIDLMRHYNLPGLALPEVLRRVSAVPALSRVVVLPAQMADQETYSSAPSQPSQPQQSSAPATIEGEVTTVETVTFHEDAAVVESQRPVAVNVDPNFVAPATDVLTNSVIGFLQRRILLSEAVWSSTSTPGTVLLQHSLPGDWIAIPMILEKLQGFRYLKMDLVFELQVNAQAFNAGALLMWEEPLADQLQYRPSSTKSLTGKTGYRNVFYIVEDATAAKLTVRFNNVLSHFDLVNRFGTMGKIYVEVASALTGAADADVSLWAWAENVDVQMPTGLTLTAQGLPDMRVSSPAKYMARQQAEKRTTGRVEETAATLSGVAASLSSAPVVGTFAAAAQPVFDIAGKVASFFGWSKPIDDTRPQLITQTQSRHMANFNGDAKSKVLSVDAENAVDIPTSVFGTDNDEMAIQEIVRRPVFLTSFTIDSTMAQNTLLWSWPLNFNTSVTVPAVAPDTGTYSINTYLSYMAKLFRFVRGGMIFTLKLIKTPYHSGRVRIFWVPGATPATTFSSIDLNKCYSEVHDIRVKNEIEFCVPFTWNAPWMSVYTTTGMVYVVLINSLRAPSTAAPAIETLVFQSGAEDVQFAYPDALGNMQIVLDAAQVPSPPRTSVLAAQGYIYPSKDSVEFAPNKLGIGEAVLSLRQLIRRYYVFVRPNAASGARQTTYRDVVWTPSPSVIDDGVSTDILSLVGVLYRYKVGALRFLKSYNTVPLGTAIQYTMSPGVDSGPQIFPTPDLLAPVVTNWTTTEPSVEMETPFYQEWPAIPTNIGAPTIVEGGAVQTNFFRTGPFNLGSDLYCIDTAGEPANTVTYRSAGESFSFGYLLGPPVTKDP